MKQTLSVTAIESGTVIDHIPPGQAIRMISLLALAAHKNQVTIGLNLAGRQGLKDLVKIENRLLTEHESQQIAIFAPHATINIIENYKVIAKHQAQAPKEVVGILRCPNPVCISRHEPIDSFFHVDEKNHRVYLHCHYCEKTFEHDEMKEYAA